VKHRVSHVEAFRKWERDEDSDLADLLAQLIGGGESEAMRAGTALHKALELAEVDQATDTLTANGYTFTFACDCTIGLAPVRELRASKTYMVDGQPIEITGQVDQLPGLRIEDHKTTGRFDPDRYLTGYQWRLYLDIFGADWFRWNVFEIGELEPLHYEVFDTHTLDQYRYPELGADCQALVERFARFMRQEVPA
jgi:hypothetical protein